ncbi:hypothetical protein MMC09_004620 [Bachmanniomyces sp. S44760]|nr:hypothetical protein [Bachmanniomyces sp. S44760]
MPKFYSRSTSVRLAVADLPKTISEDFLAVTANEQIKRVPEQLSNDAHMRILEEVDLAESGSSMRYLGQEKDMPFFMVRVRSDFIDLKRHLKQTALPLNSWIPESGSCQTMTNSSAQRIFSSGQIPPVDYSQLDKKESWPNHGHTNGMADTHENLVGDDSLVSEETKTTLECVAQGVTRLHSQQRIPCQNQSQAVPDLLGSSLSSYREHAEQHRKRVHALYLTVSLSKTSFLRHRLSSNHCIILDVKIDIFFNGELCASTYVPSRYKNEAVNLSELIQRFGGHRIARLQERPWIIIPPDQTANGNLRHDTRSREADGGAVQRWTRISEALQAEADKAGKDRLGTPGVLSQCLANLAKLEMPDEVNSSQGPGSAIFGVIDVILTTGKGQKYTAADGYLDQPTRMGVGEFVPSLFVKGNSSNRHCGFQDSASTRRGTPRELSPSSAACNRSRRLSACSKPFITPVTPSAAPAAVRRRQNLAVQAQHNLAKRTANLARFLSDVSKDESKRDRVGNARSGMDMISTSPAKGLYTPGLMAKGSPARPVTLVSSTSEYTDRSPSLEESASPGSSNITFPITPPSRSRKTQYSGHSVSPSSSTSKIGARKRSARGFFVKASHGKVNARPPQSLPQKFYKGPEDEALNEESNVKRPRLQYENILDDEMTVAEQYASIEAQSKEGVLENKHPLYFTRTRSRSQIIPSPSPLPILSVPRSSDRNVRSTSLSGQKEIQETFKESLMVNLKYKPKAARLIWSTDKSVDGVEAEVQIGSSETRSINRAASTTADLAQHNSLNLRSKGTGSVEPSSQSAKIHGNKFWATNSSTTSTATDPFAISSDSAVVRSRVEADQSAPIGANKPNLRLFVPKSIAAISDKHIQTGSAYVSDKFLDDKTFVDTHKSSMMAQSELNGVSSKISGDQSDNGVDTNSLKPTYQPPIAPQASKWQPSSLNNDCVVTYANEAVRPVKAERTGCFDEVGVLLGVRFLVD